MTDLIFVPELGLLGGKPARRGRSVASRVSRTRPRPSTIPATPEPVYFQPMIIPHPPTTRPQPPTPKFKPTTPKAHYMKEYLKRYEGLVRKYTKGKSVPKGAITPVSVRAASSGMRFRSRRKPMKDRRFTDDDFKLNRDDLLSSFRPKTAPIDIQQTLRIYGARNIVI